MSKMAYDHTVSNSSPILDDPIPLPESNDRGGGEGGGGCGGVGWCGGVQVVVDHGKRRGFIHRGIMVRGVASYTQGSW